jgi:exodeoxyribonuclease VII large subunit
MPEKIKDRTVFSLLEVTGSIQKTLHERYKSSFWVKAEMSRLNFYKHSGHCYPDLIEKKDGKILAQIRAHLWKDDYNRINNNFRNILQEPLKDGIKILFQAKISFDPSHGLALLILDIDPSYTLGDLEKEKQITIRRLKEEGVFHINKLRKLPLLPRRIAIISVETSKGYADFIKVIESNPWGYKFCCCLFPSLLQGDKAVQRISAQLKRIKQLQHHFDAVAIIRGGGGDIGLSCYNNYQLAREIALFPLPVITGIGHATNETVVEMIAFTNAITPTKLAEYLLQKFHNFAVPVQEAEQKIMDKAKRLLGEEQVKFRSEIKLFRSVTENVLATNHNKTENLTKSLLQHTRFVFRNETDSLWTAKAAIIREINTLHHRAAQAIRQFAISLHKDAHSLLGRFKIIVSQFGDKLLSQSEHTLKSSLLELSGMETNIANMSPENVLKRGYSITLLDGKAVKSLSQVKSGDSLHTFLSEGNMISIVNQINKKTDHE